MSTSSVKGRLSIWIALVVLLMIAGGVWQQQDLQRLRKEQALLFDQALNRGINPGEPDALATKPYPRKDITKEDARALAEDLKRRADGLGTYQTDWAEQMKFIDRLEALSPAQLREMIAIFLKPGEITGLNRLWVTLDLLQRLAEDFPEEAMAHITELESRAPGTSATHNVIDSLAKIATRFGEKSPDAAWRWYLDTRKGGPEGFDSIREAVLGGIAKRDPALALRYAEGTGSAEGGFYFLGHYCTTLDQRVGAIKALRTWSGEDAERKVKLDPFIKEQILKQGYEETVRFETVTSLIEQAGLTMEEIGFLGDRSKVDLAYYIDPRDTGRLIEWLDRNFPEKQSTQQIKHLMEDHRTDQGAKAWLDALPPEQAAAFKARLADE